MTDKDTQRELEPLRSEVAALSKARSNDRKQESKPESSAATTETTLGAAAAVSEAAAIDINDPDAEQSQIAKLSGRISY